MQGGGWWAVRFLHCIYGLLLIIFICVFRQEAVHHAVIKLHTTVVVYVVCKILVRQHSTTVCELKFQEEYYASCE